MFRLEAEHCCIHRQARHAANLLNLGLLLAIRGELGHLREDGCVHKRPLAAQQVDVNVRRRIRLSRLLPFRSSNIGLQTPRVSDLPKLFLRRLVVNDDDRAASTLQRVDRALVRHQ